MLSDRQRKILQIIIEDYIESAEPVGSRTIARKYDLGLSPATIRNEMSDLELLGYLEKPHTSAGRIPSAQAYRFYVDSLVEPGSLDDNDRAIIDRWYHERRRSIDEIFSSTAKILSRMTRNVSMIMANKEVTSRFKYVKFLPLDEHRAILCVVTEDGAIDNAVVEIPLGMQPPELDYLGARMTKYLEGRSLQSIGPDAMQEMYEGVAQDPALMASLNTAIRRMAGKRSQQKVFLGGAKQLLSQPEFQDMERVKELLSILEEERVVRDLLQAGKPADGETGLRITIGSENKFTGIRDCSMVQATYRLNGQIIGTMAVLGPTRMEYGKVITVMDYLHKYLQAILRNQ